MTVPKKLCPLADGSLAEAARGGGGEDDIADAGVQLQRTSVTAASGEHLHSKEVHLHTHFYVWEAHNGTVRCQSEAA